MQTLKQFFPTITLRQLVVVFIAGIFMLVTTACSGTPKAAVPAGGRVQSRNPPVRPCIPTKIPNVTPAPLMPKPTA